ncbi:hypothetical protein [Pedobacter sp. KBW06]|uniref:hypothetical protein n=1 Tax=Pedobacter sp. KBW06 TaxID=2153359 RepID=UPI000F59C70B|nr:hypothetical protein [Pedobacter sp. KBW06]
MKKYAFIPFALAIAACNNHSETTNAALSDSLQVEAAKTLLDSSNAYVARGIKKEWTKVQVNEKVNPTMEKFWVIYKKLKPADTLKVYEYRIDGINKLIDLQMKQH